MGLSFSTSSPSVGYRADTPVCLSMYMLDACRQGVLFSPETYKVERVGNWIAQWLIETTEGIVFPAHFEKRRIQQMFLNSIIRPLREGNMKETFTTIDVSDVESMKRLFEENRKKTKQMLHELEEFLKKEEFPSFLWMEFARFHKVIIQTSEFVEEIIARTFRFRPRRESQILERNRLIRARVKAFTELIDNYFGTMIWYFRLCTFMEVWSCEKEKESELFTEKCLWTFENIKHELFEPIFTQFHDSIGQLRRSFFRFAHPEIRMDLSKPTDWAFKQLISMT